MSITHRASIASELADIVGSDAVVYEEPDMALYEYDATISTARPDYVVLPETTEQVSAVARFAHEREIPLTPRGAGTSLSGGPVPVEGGIVIALTRMDRILEIDVPNHRAVVQPGVINMDLLAALEPRGFFYAPDPASQTVCTIGGNVAENAGGPHCLKYGVTANHIMGVEMVLPDGEILTAGGKALDWPGYDLTGVIVGSEGTFGVITEIVCRIMPQPEAITTMLAIFDSLDDASRAVSGIIAAGLLPATLEMMDRPLIRAVQMAFDAGYPEDAEVVLIIEIDGLRVGMERQLGRIQKVCEEHNVRKFDRANDEHERMLLWKGRKGAFGAVANISPNKLCTDVAVPRTELPRMLAEVMEIGARHGLTVGNVFHAGDGNLHPQLLYDARDPDQVARVQEADEEITKLAVSCGGVLSGEHGIGSCKRKWMPLMFSADDLRAQWTLNDVFDPWGRMNPSKVLPARNTLAAPEPWALPHGAYQDVAGRLAPRDEDGTCHPYDMEAVAKLTALASREEQSIAILGGSASTPVRTRHAEVICTLGLNKILRSDPENMTVTVEAGARWRDLQAAVAETGQFVPLRPPSPDEATVGGVIASNASGPHRLRYGSCRDLLIGVRFVVPTGEIINIGSRCAKNTSGHALEKLMIGSQGSLGVIVDATFRTIPLPEAKNTLCFISTGTDDQDNCERMRAFATEAVGGRLQPAALEALTPALARHVADRADVALELPQDNWLVAVGLEGLGEEVAEMASALGQIADEHGLAQAGTVQQAAYDAFWEDITQVGEHPMQAISPMSETMSLARHLVGRVGRHTPLRAGLGTGVIVLAPVVPEQASCDALVQDFDQLAAQCGGRAYWLPPCPDGARNPEVSGVAARLCRRIKAAYDPHSVLPALV